MEIFSSGAWRTIRRGEILIGGTWRRITRIEGYVSGQWRSLATFVPPFSASVSPSSVSGFANPFKPSTQTVTTETAVITPAGGAGPYTYVWSGGNTPTNASNSFTRTLSANTDLSESYSYTVTDSLGSTAIGSVEAYFSNQSQT